MEVDCPREGESPPRHQDQHLWEIFFREPEAIPQVIVRAQNNPKSGVPPLCSCNLLPQPRDLRLLREEDGLDWYDWVHEELVRREHLEDAHVRVFGLNL